MSHELTIRTNGKAEMAFVGAKPWHGLGEELRNGAGIDEWIVAAGDKLKNDALEIALAA